MIHWLRSLRVGIARLAAGGANLLFPPRCVFCSEDLHQMTDDLPLCADCLNRMAPATWRGCRRCGGEVLDWRSYAGALWALPERSAEV